MSQANDENPLITAENWLKFADSDTKTLFLPDVFQVAKSVKKPPQLPPFFDSLPRLN